MGFKNKLGIWKSSVCTAILLDFLFATNSKISYKKLTRVYSKSTKFQKLKIFLLNHKFLYFTMELKGKIVIYCPKVKNQLLY